MADSDYPCFHSQECREGYTMCRSVFNDGNKRCVPIPIRFTWGGWTYGKLSNSGN